MWSSLILENILLIIVATIVLCILITFGYKTKKKVTLKEITKSEYIKIFWSAVFIGYLCAVANVTDMFETSGFFSGGGVNLLPFKGIEEMIADLGYRSEYCEGLGIQIDFLVGNVVMFIPLGFIAPILFKKCNSYKSACITGFIGTLTVELVQIILGTGNLDIDDIIYNVLGTVLGYGLYLIIKKSFIKGLIPYISVGAVVIASIVIYNVLPYGVCPGFHIYDAPKSKNVNCMIDLDTKQSAQKVYKNADVKLDKNIGDKLSKDIYEHVGVEYYEDTQTEMDWYDIDKTSKTGIELGDKKYLSNDEIYRLSVDYNGDFNFTNREVYQVLVKESRVEDETPISKDKNNENIEKNIDYIVSFLQLLGYDFTKEYISENNTAEDGIHIELKYEVGNNKLKKDYIGVVMTKDGHIASILRQSEYYTYTDDEVTLISEKEAYEKLISGKSGDKVPNGYNVIDVELSWLNTSKGYYVPMYIFATSKKDTINDDEKWYYYHVRGWK